MSVVGIIAEYNPFHNGHMAQFRKIRELLGEDTSIVCLMSGDFVQRGEPAWLEKEARAAAAVECGADLVLELPVTYSLRSAEGFAAGGVRILSALGICNYLCFGCEDPEKIIPNAALLEMNDYEEALHSAISEGLSYPAAVSKAAQSIGGSANVFLKPNNILGIEYCKAIHKQNSSLIPLPIQRTGAYHSTDLSEDAPSAESIRASLSLSHGIPENAMPYLNNSPRYYIRCGETAMLGKLRSLKKEDLNRLPNASEGLWNKIFKAVQCGKSYQGIIEEAKTKRYPYTRITRMLMCAYLGINAEELSGEAPWVMLLGFTKRGRLLLREAAKEKNIGILHPGERIPENSYGILYRRTVLLYDLFCEEANRYAVRQKNFRVFNQIKKDQEI